MFKKGSFVQSATIKWASSYLLDGCRSFFAFSVCLDQHPEEHHDVLRMYSKKLSADTEVEDELIQKYPDLSGCRFLSEYKEHEQLDDYPLLVLLALEDEGVDFIAYYGLDPKQGWFQSIGEWSFKKMIVKEIRPENCEFICH